MIINLFQKFYLKAIKQTNELNMKPFHLVWCFEIKIFLLFSLRHTIYSSGFLFLPALQGAVAALSHSL